MTARIKCLTCKRIMDLADKQKHIQEKDHTRYIEFIGELSEAQQAAKLLLDDEMAGMHTMKIKLETLHLLRKISTTIEAATFDIVITKALEALLREREHNSEEYEFGTEEQQGT